MLQSTWVKSKWLLAAVILLGLFYFEGRLFERPSKKQPTSYSR